MYYFKVIQQSINYSDMIIVGSECSNAREILKRYVAKEGLRLEPNSFCERNSPNDKTYAQQRACRTSTNQFYPTEFLTIEVIRTPLQIL